ncbi:MAG: 5-formyltetrahydrofolate cyclo-ligase [Firmicutes bacterium]|nr:5-formyltetrahydrofolate cyclo-ligase [Bacillota bacterium]
MDKKTLRKTAKERRASFYPTAEREKEDRYIFEEVRKLWNKYDKIFLYHSFGSEVDTEKLIRAAFREDKKVFLPRITSGRITSGKEMRFHQIRPDTKLISHVYGMQEPPEDCPISPADENTLIVVPGLLFDRKGYRLGYGGGYYDRYIREHPQAMTVGICYSIQMTEDLPVEAYDQHVRLMIGGSEMIEITEQE